MEAVVAGVGQVQWALAGHLSAEKGLRTGASVRCGYGGVAWGSRPAVRCASERRREEALRVRAVSADGGGGEGNGERFGRGGGGGDNGGNGGDYGGGGRDGSSGGDDAGGRAPESSSGILAWYLSYSSWWS